MTEDKRNTNKQPGQDTPRGKEDKPKGKFNFYWIYGILIVVFLAIQFLNWGDAVKSTDLGELKKMLADGDVEKITLINKERAEVFIKDDRLSKSRYEEVRDKRGTPGPEYYYNVTSPDSFKEDVESAQQNLPEEDWVYIENKTERNWGGEILGWVLPIALLLGVWFFIMRMMSRGGGGPGGQIFNIGKSKAQLFDKSQSVTVTFSDVAGLEEAKVEVMEVVDFLKNPQKYTELGGKIPKGALLIGPPGTGKTLLAKAVAGEAQVPFFSISGSDFVEMFVGVGASRVRDLFKQAKEKAPCIIFIDEIDAIGRARGKNPMTGANDERENTLNQLLTEMDGFSSNTGVIILAATNRADILDRALMRAGRFDRQIHVELPDLEERKAIFKVHLRPLVKINKNVDLEFLAKQTPGFSGADIANVCNEAALIAARKNKKEVDRQDFMDAIDRIIGGLEKRNKIISQHEKKTIAFHESGHASVSWLLEHAHPLVKVTIVPRGKALGAAWYLPEERQITTYEQLFDEMTAALGGRAAEQVIFGKISTGALNDLEKVTKQAYNMVVYFGLNDKIGNISYYDSTGQQEYSFTKPYSEKTAELIDQEVKKMIELAYKRAKEILAKHKDQLVQLANKLLDREVIFSTDLEEIYGKRPWDEKKKQEEEQQRIQKKKLSKRTQKVIERTMKENMPEEKKEEKEEKEKKVPEKASGDKKTKQDKSKEQSGKSKDSSQNKNRA
ncbi:MAG: ATP-dependent zinc metalloprotease FtsH [Bacteroidales bacterium]|nr:ATP-dependent zinc metalloprotease FtsH [Bacteroidales bacterium]MCF8377505.1 ATP-dependent zinc metalloprotease FtsH [Bacteroidales bacterium]MCF8401628.1 ATP-dependent zinc metalloprotease FtsH [Bacteroidales bacterium]